MNILTETVYVCTLYIVTTMTNYRKYDYSTNTPVTLISSHTDNP
jgi:hypothetical protein